MTDFTPSLFPGARIAGSTHAGEPHAVVDPADQRLVAQVGWVGVDVVEEAVAAAVSVRESWGQTPASKRAEALRAIAAELRGQVDDLAVVIAAESGKRLVEARGEVEFSARYLDWFAQAATIADHETAGPVTAERRFRVRHHPVGVVAALGTWNFPLSIPVRKVAASVAAGCPTILKPSERTPITTDLFVQLCERHLPAGVIGHLVGDHSVAIALIEHPQVAAVTFTGSSAVGAQVGARAAASHTRAVLELGGRAPFIIRADADPELAVESLLVAAFRNNGESCIAANNVFVHADVFDAVWDSLATRVKALRVGAQEDEGADVGPMIDQVAADRIRTLVAEAEASGARVVRGQGDNGQTLVAPALVDCAAEPALWDQEQFGPVIAVQRFTDEDAVVATVNGWGLGLAGYVCGSDLVAAERLGERLRVGIVGINNGAPNTPEVPFGGFGASGIGREGGLAGYLEFVESQTISVAQ